MNPVSFADIAVVACGTMSLELNHLRSTGFLDTPRIYDTTPKLHQEPPELERQRVRLVARAEDSHGKVIVVYGGKFCYVNVDAPTRLLQTIIQDQGLANENFPKHTGEAIVLDGIGYMDAFMAGDPEGFLEYADWMGIPIIPFTIALDRLKSFLAHQVMTLNDAG